MTDAAPLLTIAIPTCNRAQSLIALLNSIVQDLAPEAAAKLEILVSDNGSTDDTAARAAPYSAAHGLVYRRNPHNLGYDGNIASLIPAARGEFVWIMGDDDRVAPGALSRLLQLLSDDPADLLLLPGRRDEEPDTANHASARGITTPVRAELNQFLNSFGLMGTLGGVGHSVFRRRLLTGLDVYPAMGTKFCHVFLFAQSFARREAVFRPETYFVTPKYDEATWAEYCRRWESEGLMLEGWYNCLRALLHAFDAGGLPLPRDKSFFRMMFNQDWPLHYHVYGTVWDRIYRREDIDWEGLQRFDRMLDDSHYTIVLNGLQKAEAAQKRVLEITHQLVRTRQGIYSIAR
jgi:glycosyltransferase involved in cell wall biosynthesis